MVTGSYFSTLGIRPAAGRLLDGSDDRRRGAHPVAVLSHAFWQRHFAGRADAVGAVGDEIHVNGRPFRIVGVAEAGFRGTDWGDPPAIWTRCG